MGALTRENARAAKLVSAVRLDASTTGYVRRLPGTYMEDIVVVAEREDAARHHQMVALCSCAPDGAPLFDPGGGIDAISREVADWPMAWVLKLSIEAQRLNGLDLEDDDDPKPEPDAQ